MIDKNNNNNGDAFVNSTSETPSEALTVWLKDHTDPHINPWSAEKWKQARELLKDDYWDHQENCAQQRHPNCIDPTANRLLQLLGLNAYCIFMYYICTSLCHLFVMPSGLKIKFFV